MHHVANKILISLFIIVIGVTAAGKQAVAEEQALLSYDISWPQCPDTVPAGEFEFAVIGLTGGRPFTANKCFDAQYAWASTAQENPDVYINLDFPKQGRVEAASGPYGVCGEFDQWCRGYNYGYALGKDSVRQAQAKGIAPGRYWFDVEMDNYWTNWPPFNAQVVRGALDYFLDFHLPIGIYGTRYQWDLITGGLQAPGRLPLWVAGATSREMAAERCNKPNYTFAGGETWMVQYPEGPFDGNVLCDLARKRQDQREARDNFPRAAAPAPEPVQEPIKPALPAPSPAAASRSLPIRTLTELRQLVRR